MANVEKLRALFKERDELKGYLDRISPFWNEACDGKPTFLQPDGSWLSFTPFEIKSRLREIESEVELAKLTTATDTPTDQAPPTATDTTADQPKPKLVHILPDAQAAIFAELSKYVEADQHENLKRLLAGEEGQKVYCSCKAVQLISPFAHNFSYAEAPSYKSHLAQWIADHFEYLSAKGYKPVDYGNARKQLSELSGNCK